MRNIKEADYFLFSSCQASEDAKKLVNQEKSFACAEIESARAVVLRLGEAFEEQERNSEASRAQGPVSIMESSFIVVIIFSYQLMFSLHRTWRNWLRRFRRLDKSNECIIQQRCYIIDGSH